MNELIKKCFNSNIFRIFVKIRRKKKKYFGKNIISIFRTIYFN